MPGGQERSDGTEIDRNEGTYARDTTYEVLRNLPQIVTELKQR